MANSKSKRKNTPTFESEKDLLQKLQKQLEETNSTISSSIIDSNSQLQTTREMLGRL